MTAALLSSAHLWVRTILTHEECGIIIQTGLQQGKDETETKPSKNFIEYEYYNYRSNRHVLLGSMSIKYNNTTFGLTSCMSFFPIHFLSI